MLWSLLLHLPSTPRAIRRLSFLINTTLLLFAVDLVLSPIIFDAQNVVFTRVGAIDEESVKIVVRYPQENSTEGLVRLLYRPVTHTSADEPWKNGPLFNLSVSRGLLVRTATAIPMHSAIPSSRLVSLPSLL